MRAKRESIAWHSVRTGTEEVSHKKPRVSSPPVDTGPTKAPRIGRNIVGQAVRITLFAAIVVGSTVFVLHTRWPEVTSLAGIGAPASSAAARASLGETPPAPSSAPDTMQAQERVYGYYILSRLARARAEAQEIATLRSVADDPRLSLQARAQAAANLDLVAKWAREETEIETLLASQGFPESVVVISNARAMVVVPAQGMTAEKAARIGTDVWNLANIPPQEVLVEPHA